MLPLVLGGFLQATVTVSENSAESDFPEALRFHLEAESSVPIQSVELEFRSDALSCGDGWTSSTPEDFTGGESITADWTWEFRRTGPIPPGTTITWRWVFYGEDSEEVFTTDEQTLTLEDASQSWQQIESEHLQLNWYSGDQEFANTLLEAGETAVADLEELLKFDVQEQVRLYMYADSQDMQSSTLFAPAWSGGLAYSAENALLLAIAPGDLDWGVDVVRHELTHVIVGRAYYSCVRSTPTWFEEGFAMYMEGEPDPYYVNLVQSAVNSNELLSVRELGQIFSGNSELASLSYGQSLSLVTYLVEEHGQEKLIALMEQWEQGASEDTALTEVYGFDRDGLEAGWREWIGAQPMEESAETVIATPTAYPTYAPIGEPPQAVAEVWPTPDYLSEAPTTGEGTAPLDPFQGVDGGGFVPLLIGLLCCVGLIVLGAIIAAVVIFRRRKPAAATGINNDEYLP